MSPAGVFPLDLVARQATYNYTGDWAYIDIANQTQSEFIPWDWYITPTLPNYVCPSTTSILVTFGVVNVLVSLLNLIMGHRNVVNKVTFGLFGKELGNSWMFMFLMPLGVQLGANAFIAFLYQNTPGYEKGFSITDLMLFYTTRPRLGWIVLSLVMHWGRIGGEGSWGGYDEKIQDGYYEGAAKGAILAEIFLLVISSYYYGRTVHFATTHGYYLMGHLKGPYAHNARIMYVGALLFIVALYASLFYLLALLGVVGIHLGRKAYISIWSIGTTTWLASWLFWGGYVALAKDLYCPPRLVESGAIWTTFSIIGTFFGGGF